MIFKNVELYNVSEVQETDKGYAMLRYPKAVADNGLDSLQRMNTTPCGVEIRFNIDEGEAELTLSTAEPGKTSFAMIYYGDVGASWQHCMMPIFDTPTKIVIPKPENVETLKLVSDKMHSIFDPSLVRVLFPVSVVCIHDIKGCISVPREDQVPKVRYLAYGSSITHGSLGILPVNTYAYKTAHALGADLINIGVAGGACLEKAVADYIASRSDYSFCSLEMGVNILNIEPEDFENRVMYFAGTIAKGNPAKKVFCIDQFYNHNDIINNPKIAVFREIVKSCSEKLYKDGCTNIVYINGLDCLGHAGGLSADFVHPSICGCDEIAQNLAALMKKHL